MTPGGESDPFATRSNRGSTRNSEKPGGDDAGGGGGGGRGGSGAVPPMMRRVVDDVMRPMIDAAEPKEPCTTRHSIRRTFDITGHQ